MSYVDGYLLPVPEKNLEAYRTMASKAGAIWMEYGALSYKECVMDDDYIKDMLSFSDVTKVAPGEKAIFAFIVFKDREHRDEVNAKVMSDPRLKESCNGENMPFDFKRMAYGGFLPLVDL